MTRVGIIGAGQLGQMLGYASRAIDAECVFLDPSPEPPARTAGEVRSHEFTDVNAVRQLAGDVDVVTYEFENVPVASVQAIGGTVPVYPPPAALEHAQDRLLEKTLFAELDIPVSAFRPVDSEAGLEAACRELGYPLVLKTRRLGYDGKGQAVLRSAADLPPAWASLGGVPLLVERMVGFDYEVSAIGARSARGETAIYPLTQNDHRDGILRTSRAPAGTGPLNAIARGYLGRLIERLDYVGVLALELFVEGDRLLANEFAPRVHNSGHWTIEGATTSQFENHLRAVLGMPLGETGAVGAVAMENLIGTMPPDPAALEAAGFFLHDYGKAPRPGRKLGHVTLVAEDADRRDARLAELRRILSA